MLLVYFSEGCVRVCVGWGGGGVWVESSGLPVFCNPNKVLFETCLFEYFWFILADLRMRAREGVE